MSHGAHHKNKPPRDLEGAAPVRDAARAKELARSSNADEIEATMNFEDAVTTDGGKYKVPRPDSLGRSLVGGSLR